MHVHASGSGGEMENERVRSVSRVCAVCQERECVNRVCVCAWKGTRLGQVTKCCV